MALTGERVSSDAPLFIKQGMLKEKYLVAGFSKGNTFLDIGCGESDLYTLIEKLGMEYTGVDLIENEFPGYIKMDIFSFLSNIQEERWGTVACVQVIEHVDPGKQYYLLELLWKVTEHRLILGLPDNEAEKNYPDTDWLFGKNNPFHTREISKALLYQYIYEACSGMAGKLDVCSYLDNQTDELIYFNDYHYPAYRLLIMDKL